MSIKKQTTEAIEKKTEEKWWQKGVKVFGVEAPILLLVGVLIGIILSYTFMFSNPDLFLRPAISYAVRETVAAQSFSTMQTPAMQTPATTPIATTDLSQSNFFDGQQLIYDNFSEKIFLWSEGSIGTESVGYENGIYYLDLSDPDIYFTALLWSVNNEIIEMKDFAIQVDALGSLYTEQKQGLVFGFQSDKIGNSYAYDLSSDGTCRLVSRTDDGIWEVISTSWLSDFDPNKTHIITVIMKDSRIFTGYIDGRMCLTQFIDYDPGIFGVVGKVSQYGGKLFFDNFYIYKIP